MAAELHLVRDLLDKKVVDRDGREIGRVDGVIVEVAAPAPPRVTAIEIGPSILFRRVRPFLGRWMAGLERALALDAGRPVRIPFAAILEIRDHVCVDVASRETPAATLEHRLRNLFSTFPGGS